MDTQTGRRRDFGIRAASARHSQGEGTRGDCPFCRPGAGAFPRKMLTLEV